MTNTSCEYIIKTPESAEIKPAQCSIMLLFINLHYDARKHKSKISSNQSLLCQATSRSRGPVPTHLTHFTPLHPIHSISICKSQKWYNSVTFSDGNYKQPMHLSLTFVLYAPPLPLSWLPRSHYKQLVLVSATRYNTFVYYNNPKLR